VALDLNRVVVHDDTDVTLQRLVLCGWDAVADRHGRMSVVRRHGGGREEHHGPEPQG
jgi:hypothetical protein